MLWFLLVADLYFLSVGIRSMLEYGPDQYNIVMVFCFSLLALIIGLNIYLIGGAGGRAWAEGSLFSLWNDIISKHPILHARV